MQNGQLQRRKLPVLVGCFWQLDLVAVPTFNPKGWKMTYEFTTVPLDVLHLGP